MGKPRGLLKNVIYPDMELKDCISYRLISRSVQESTRSHKRLDSRASLVLCEYEETSNSLDIRMSKIIAFVS
jgi:hypothetical protein